MSNFLPNNYYEILLISIKIILILIPLIICIAYLTLAERRIIGLMQLRKGPNIVGPFGLLQPIADGIKLLFKEVIIPKNSNKIMFIMAPMITFILSLIGWAVIPFSKKAVIANINVGVLYLLAISALHVYGMIMAGWASNSKYAFIGAIRSTAQIISYEVSMGLIIITVLLATGTLNLIEIVERQAHLIWWIKLLLFPMGIIFFISMLAETNRLPFDLSEAETELVAGYNVEYSSLPFALFFLGEYANMIIASSFTTILFLGGYLPPFNLEILNFIPHPIWFILKITFLLFCFLWIRASLPRYRYDQLMRLGWKIFLPLTFSWMILMASILLYTGNLPTHSEEKILTAYFNNANSLSCFLEEKINNLLL